jgi:hypothetical protein
MSNGGAACLAITALTLQAVSEEGMGFLLVGLACFNTTRLLTLLPTPYSPNGKRICYGKQYRTNYQ